MPQHSIFADRRALILIATLCCLLWGSAVPAVKFGYGLLGIAPGDLPSLLLFGGMRFCLAGLLLLAYGMMSGRQVWAPPRRFGQLALLGFGQTTVQYLCYYVGLAHTTAVKASIISSTLVFFSVLLAHFIYTNDRLTPRRVAGCLIGFAGVVAANVASGGLEFSFTLLGEGMLLLSTFAGSLAAIYGRRLSQDMDATVMTGWQLLLGGLLPTAIGIAGGGHLAQFSVGAGLLIVYLAAVSAVAFALWSVLLKHNPVGSVAVFNFEIPVFGVLISALVLGESVFEWKNLAALILVSAGIWLVTRRSSAVALNPPT